MSLIFDRGDDTLLTPVDVLGEFLYRLHLVVGWEVALRVESFKFGFGATVKGTLFGGGEVAHVVNIFFP